MTTEAEQLANDLVGGYSEPTRLESAATPAAYADNARLSGAEGVRS